MIFGQFPTFSYFLRNLAPNQSQMCGCSGGNRRSKPKMQASNTAVPTQTAGTNQILVQQNQLQEQRERNLQRQIMARPKVIFKK